MIPEKMVSLVSVDDSSGESIPWLSILMTVAKARLAIA